MSRGFEADLSSGKIMSVAPLRSSVPASGSSRGWIISSWLDQLLIVLTPLLVIPAVLFLHKPIGVKAETIALVVTAFFAIGHHLPGLIRAYGDAELFRRFRWRFLLAPPVFLIAYFPLIYYHRDFYPFVILLWATWHGLMQLYGFVRIYDAKVGSVSYATAYWDWLVCLCGFVTIEAFSPSRSAFMLNSWYSLGGPLIPATAISICRWCCLGVSIFILTGFVINYVVQWKRGPRPNPIKLLLLASGIGSWWVAIGYLENAILGAALFDICHDVQYVAIVWLYNCRRVNSNTEISGFMKYVFRRGMVLFYLGLIAAYGSIGLIPALVQNGTMITFFNGILGTSTLLHYYYDGFIWKVRERSTQASLGLNENSTSPSVRQMTAGGMPHLLKWSPLIGAVGWLFLMNASEPSLLQSRKDELEQLYTRTLSGTTVLPETVEERSWVYSIFERVQNIATAVPDDRLSQLHAAAMLANFGRNDEAMTLLEKLLTRDPGCSEGHTFLGAINMFSGNLDKASACFQMALTHATLDSERAMAHLKLGEVYQLQHDRESAELRFEEALRGQSTAEDRN